MYGFPPRTNPALAQRKKDLQARKVLLRSWSPEVLRGCRFIQNMLMGRSCTGVSFGETLPSADQDQFDRCLTHLTWPSAVLDLGLRRHASEAVPSILELAADPHVVATLGWGVLHRILNQLGTDASQIQSANALLRRQFFRLLAALDHQCTASVDSHPELISCIQLLYAAVGGDRAGDVLTAPHLESDCAALTEEHLRVTRVADWLVGEKRWNALTICVYTLTESSHLPLLLLMLPVLTSSSDTSAVIVYDPAVLACEYMTQLEPDTTTAKTPCAASPPSRGTILNGGVPLSSIARCHRVDVAERVEVLEVMWASIVNTPAAVFATAVAPLLAGVPMGALRYRSPCSGRALIHYAMIRHHAPLVSLLMQLDPSQATLLSSAPAKRHLRHGKLPLQVALEHASDRHTTSLTDVITPLVEPTVIRQYLDPAEVPHDAVVGLLETCIGRGFGRVLGFIVSCMTHEQFALHFRTLATFAALSSHTDILQSVFSADQLRSMPALSLSLILDDSPGSGSPFVRAAIAGNVHALEAMRGFANNASVPEGAVELCNTCINRIVDDYLMSGGAQMHHSASRFAAVRGGGSANAEHCARLIEAQRCHQKLLAVAIPIVVDILSSHLQDPEGLQCLKFVFIQLRACDPDGPDARWLNDLRHEIPLLQKALQSSLCVEASSIETLALTYAQQWRPNTFSNTKETMSMLLSEYLLSASKDDDADSRLRFAESLIVCAARYPTSVPCTAAPNRAVVGWLQHFDELCGGLNEGIDPTCSAFVQVASLVAIRHHPLTESCFPDNADVRPQLWMVRRLARPAPTRNNIFSMLHCPPHHEDGTHVLPFSMRVRAEMRLGVHHIVCRRVGVCREQHMTAVIDALLRLDDGAALCPAVVAALLENSAKDGSVDVIDSWYIFQALLTTVSQPELCPSLPRRVDVVESLLQCLPISCGLCFFREVSKHGPKRLLRILALLCMSDDALGAIGNLSTVWAAAVDTITLAFVTDLDCMFPESSDAHANPTVMDSIAAVSRLTGVACDDFDSHHFFDSVISLLKSLIATSTSTGVFAGPWVQATMSVRPIARKLLLSLPRSITLLAVYGPPQLRCISNVPGLCALSIGARWLVEEGGRAPAWLPHLAAHALSTDDSCSTDKHLFCRQIWAALLVAPSDAYLRDDSRFLSSRDSVRLQELLLDVPYIPEVRDGEFDTLTQRLITKSRSFSNHWSRLLDTEFRKHMPPAVLKGLITPHSPRTPHKTDQMLLCDGWLDYLRFPSTLRPAELPSDDCLPRCLLTAVGWFANSPDDVVRGSKQRFKSLLTEMHLLLPQAMNGIFIGALVAGVQLFQHVHIADAVLDWVCTVSGNSLTFSVSDARTMFETLTLNDESSAEEVGEAEIQTTLGLSRLWCYATPFLDAALRHLAAQQRLLEHFSLLSCNDVVAKGVLGIRCSSKAYWCIEGLQTHLSRAPCSGERTNDFIDSMIQVLQANPCLATPLVAASLAMPMQREIISPVLRTYLWKPYFSALPSLSEWYDANVGRLAAPIRKCLLDVMQSSDTHQEAQTQKRELDHMQRSASESPLPLSTLFEEACGEVEPVLAAIQRRNVNEGRLSQAQLSFWPASTLVPPQTPRQMVKQHFTLQLPEFWNIIVDVSQDVRNRMTPQLVGTLSIPLAVMEQLQACTDAAYQWAGLDMARFRLFLEGLGTSPPQAHGSVSPHPYVGMLDFLAASCPRPGGASRNPSRWTPVLTLQVMLHSGSFPWRLFPSDSDHGTLRLDMSIDSDVQREGSIDLPFAPHGGGASPFTTYRDDEDRLSPRVVLVPLAAEEDARLVEAVSRRRSGQALIKEYMKIAIGLLTATPPKDGGIHIVQRSVVDVIRDMFDAGLPEVTLGLLQAMLSRHQTSGDDAATGAAAIDRHNSMTSLSRQLSSATSVDEDDLLCCVCLSNSLLDKPVMLSCFHLICETCVKSLNTHGKRKCPICNAFSIGSPKIRVVLPEPGVAAPTVGDAVGISSTKDEFSEAPSFVAELCRLVLKDMAAIGLPSLQQLRGEVPTTRVRIYIFLARELRSMYNVKRWLAILSAKIRPVAVLIGLSHLAPGHAYESSRGSPGAILNYLLGPQPPVAAVLEHSITPVAPWCVQTWTWVGSTVASPIGTAREVLSDDVIRDVASHFGAARVPAPRRTYDSHGAATREDRMEWGDSAPN
jgi:hypothetical protein